MIEEEITQQELVYMSDDMYLPFHYKGMVVKEPYFSGSGNHYIAELENICQQYKEYSHQQKVIKQSCMKIIVKLKFNKNL
jgi:hypothetical protein